ncbi:MAG: ribonuclease J [Myxococcales bacterium]|nr:ribonuclease J [Myxococcales bacterium]
MTQSPEDILLKRDLHPEDDTLSENDAPPVHVTFLGGLEEVGMNATLLSWGSQRILIDCGVNFPNPVYAPGAQQLHPSFEGLVQEGTSLTGIVLTHGHEDHIGALSQLFALVDGPIYGTAFTIGLVKSKLAERGVRPDTEVIQPGKSYQIGDFSFEWVLVPHSIPGACALVIETPQGRIVHSGDLKMDLSAPNHKGGGAFSRFGALGEEGVDLLLLESTNVHVRGFAASEASLVPSFEQIFAQTKGRIFLVTFASHVERMGIAIQAARQFGRKIAIAGSSIDRNLHIARELGYLHLLEREIISLDDAQKLPGSRVLVLATGSQGEPMASIARLSRDEYPPLRIEQGDTVLWSARWIPGNENSISYVQDQLIARGADILDPPLYNIHVTGHGYRGDLQMAIKLLRPRALVPIHGEQRFLMEHKKLAVETGLAEEDVFVCRNGERLQLSERRVDRAGHVDWELVYRGHPDAPPLGSEVLRQRRQLARDGLLVVHSVLDAQGSLVGDMMIESLGVTASAPQLYEEWPAFLVDVFFQIPVPLRSNLDAVSQALKRALRQKLRSLDLFPQVLVTLQQLRDDADLS